MSEHRPKMHRPPPSRVDWIFCGVVLVVAIIIIWGAIHLTYHWIPKIL